MRNWNQDVGSSGEEIDCVVRPGGMLVQKRDEGVDDGRARVGVATGGPLINIRVYYGSSQHELQVPAQSTFGDLKKILVPHTGLQPEDQKLLFRGNEKGDEEYLHLVGVKDRSKLLLLENSASRERKLAEVKRSNEVASACKAVAEVKTEVDKLSEKVASVESTIREGTKVADKEFVVLTELLMRQLLKLDGIEAEGEAKVQRKSEVRRIQNLVDAVDGLKARNSNPFSSKDNAVSVTTNWETFESGVGSLSSPPPMPSSTRVTQDWEQFD